MTSRAVTLCLLAGLPARAQAPPASAAAPVTATAPAPEPAPVAQGDRLSRLEQEVAELRQALAEERRARAASQAPAPPAPPPPAPPWTSPPAASLLDGLPVAGPLHLGGLRATVGGYLQADAVAYRQDSEDQLDAAGRPLNQTRFLIRRAHLRADAGWRFLAGALELEASTVDSTGVRLFGAEVAARWAGPDRSAPPYLEVGLGLLRIPFGFEVQERDPARLFLDWSTVARALFPGVNDLGLRLQGGYRLLRYQVALMNGHPLGEAAFPGLDPTANKDVLGRIGIDTPLGGGVALVAGISGLVGRGLHAGAAATKDALVWRDQNGDGVVQPSEVQATLGSAATPSQGFDRYAVGADLRLTATLPALGRLCVFGELLWAANLDRALLVADPVSVGRDLREIGGAVGLTQEITRYALVGVRYDRYSPDADAASQQGARRVPIDTSYSTVAVAVAGQLPPWGRVVVEYDRNGNALGRTASGAPATLGSDALTFRVQLGF